MKSFIIVRSLLLGAALCLQFLLIKMVKDNIDKNKALNVINKEGVMPSANSTPQASTGFMLPDTGETKLGDQEYLTVR